MISEAPAFDKFSLMAWTRRVGAYLQEDLKRWDERPMTFPDEYREELLSWFDVVLESSPVPIAVMLPSEVPTTIISDASGIGWGAVALYGNSHKTAQGRWPHEIQSSVAAEPKGVLQAVRQLVSTDEKIVLILTDHKPLVYASQSLAPRSFHYNNLLLHLRTEFPSTKFLFQFLPGFDNVADAISRDNIEALDLVKARQFAGMGWSTALNYLMFGPPCLKCLSPTLPWQY